TTRRLPLAIQVRAVDTGIFSSGNSRTFPVATTARRTRWSYWRRGAVCMGTTQSVAAQPLFPNPQ
ncbi:MAG: hypothetical protein ACPHRO_08775, partial [Nannocystaceae bacterium]